MTDEEYLTALLNRDEEVLDQLMTQYSRLLWLIATKYLSDVSSNTEDIEEVVSDVYLRLWRHPEGFNSARGSLKTYLAVLTRSMALNKRKDLTKRIFNALEDDMLDREPLLEASFDMDWKAFYEAVMTLDPMTREIIIQRYFFDRQPREIQVLTGYEAKYIDNQLYHGKRKLARHFKELGGEIG